MEEANDPEDTDCTEYLFNLPDGVPSRFRYYILNEQHAVAYLRVPNRDVLDDPSRSLQICAARVANRFAESHQTLDMSEEAKAAYLGFQTLLNVQANAAVKASPAPFELCDSYRAFSS